MKMDFLALPQGFSQGMDRSVGVAAPWLLTRDGRGCEHVEDVIQQHAEGKTLEPAAGDTHTVHLRNLGDPVVIRDHESEVAALEDVVGGFAVSAHPLIVPGPSNQSFYSFGFTNTWHHCVLSDSRGGFVERLT